MRKATCLVLLGLAWIVSADAPAGGGAENPAVVTWTAEYDLAAGQGLRIENLVGSIAIVGGGEAGKVRVAARVVAEAATPQQADALARGITLDPSPAEGPLLLHVRYPVDRHAAYRLPRSETTGVFARWLAPLLRRDRTALAWDGRIVEIGPVREAAAIAVHLEVEIPNGLDAKVFQAVGAASASRVRGTILLDNVEGGVVAEQVYGSLDARSARGDAVVRSFQGDALTIATTSGDIEIADVRARAATLRSAGGSVRGKLVEATDVAVETGGGDTEITDLEPTHLKLRTDSGSADVGTRLVAAKSVAIETGSGNVRLRVGPNAPFSLEARSTREVDTKGLAGLETVRRDAGAAAYRRGSGGAAVSIASASGRVEVGSLEGR